MIEINTLLKQIKALQLVECDEKSRLKLKASIEGINLCDVCYKNNSVFLFSKEHLCSVCFKEKYGDIVLRAENGEYYGGHKLYLAGGKFDTFESGKMYLTTSHFIFNRSNKDPQKIWEILIPLNSIDTDRWQINEESRRKNIIMGGAGSDSAMIASGIINETGKRHRLVIPYTDENEISQSPVFGISSLSGNAIRDWATNLYQQVINNKKILKESKANDGVSKNRIDSITDPLTIVKLRFAKGEITREEFEEMKKLLE